ncbi:hypothetical protein KJ693_01320 [bacterium]|nr:hypothetical protein [bacterium]MBU1613930.1 hypothetical protein [bacterium]
MKIDFNTFISAEYNNDYRMPIRELFEDEDRLKYKFDFVRFPEECIKYLQYNKEYHKGLYHLLDTYERFFVNNELKGRYGRIYCQVYYCFYCFLKEKSWREELSNDTKSWIQRKWLSICVNSASDPDIEYFFQNSRIDPTKPIDAEFEIHNILFDDTEKLKKEFDGPEQKPYLESVLDWFLKRYNLTTAFQIISQIEKHRFFVRLLKWIYRTNQSLIVALCVLLSVISLPLLTKFSIDCVTSGTKFLNDFPIFKNPGIEYFNKDLVIYNNLISPLLAFIYLGLLVLVPYFAFTRSVMWLKLIVLRLSGAIILGFLVLWTTGDVWKYSINITPGAAGIIFVVANLIAYLYLKIEITNAKVVSSEIKARAAIIWLLGIVESLIMSLVISDFSAQYFITIESHHPLCGIFGIIYPQVVFIYSALALLIGIFVQIIWEEKPITQSL